MPIIATPSTPLLLNVPASTAAYKTAVVTLTATYTIAELKPICEHLGEVFAPREVRDRAHPEAEPKFVHMLYTDLRFKADYVAIVASILADGDNLRTYFSLLDPHSQRLLETLYEGLHVAEEDLLEPLNAGGAFGKLIVEIDKVPAAVWVKSISDSFYYYRRSTPTYFLPTFIWMAVGTHIFAPRHREQIERQGVAALPSDSTGTVYESEQDMGRVLTVMQQMIQQGLLAYSTKKPGVALLRKVTRQTGMPEFGTDDGRTRPLAAALLVPAVVAFCRNGSFAVTDYWKSLRNLVETYPLNDVYALALAHVKGLRRDTIDYYSKCRELADATRGVVAKLTVGLWYSVDDISLRLLCRGLTRDMLSAILPHEIERYIMYVERGEKREDVCIASTVRVFQQPLISGVLAYLAAVGAVDVLCAADAPRLGAFGFITHVRLTPLGAYILHATRSYKPQGAALHKSAEYFTLDSEHLIIRCLDIDDANPYEAALTVYAEPIGLRRYRVTAATFLKDCATGDDIKRKIRTFRENIAPSPEGVWVDFLKDMASRYAPLRDTASDYVVKRLPEGHPELRRLIAQSRPIRAHSLLAEGDVILIERRYLSRVRDEIRRLGYIV